jgi:hypothetical protein
VNARVRFWVSCSSQLGTYFKLCVIASSIDEKSPLHSSTHPRTKQKRIFSLRIMGTVLPLIKPMSLRRVPGPFSDLDWEKTIRRIPDLAA